MTPDQKAKAKKKKFSRDYEVRAAKARIENLRRVIEDAKKNIVSLKGQLADLLQGPVSIKFKRLQTLRADGASTNERRCFVWRASDEEFHPNGSG